MYNCPHLNFTSQQLMTCLAFEMKLICLSLRICQIVDTLFQTLLQIWDPNLVPSNIPIFLKTFRFSSWTRMCLITFNGTQFQISSSLRDRFLAVFAISNLILHFLLILNWFIYKYAFPSDVSPENWEIFSMIYFMVPFSTAIYFVIHCHLAKDEIMFMLKATTWLETNCLERGK